MKNVTENCHASVQGMKHEKLTSSQLTMINTYVVVSFTSAQFFIIDPRKITNIFVIQKSI